MLMALARLTIRASASFHALPATSFVCSGNVTAGKGGVSLPLTEAVEKLYAQIEC